MTVTVEQLVDREVRDCLSYLISTLAAGYGCVATSGRGGDVARAERDLAHLCEQAFELSCSVNDNIEAAEQAGFKRFHDHGSDDLWWKKDDGTVYESLDKLMDGEGLEPYEWEVFEHWAVSSWLAEKLIEQGEKVDTDFAGLNVWARTCTGQAIAMDGVMVRIHAALVAS
jgi:hypothetical protein